jgi:hypothetical protein
MPRTASVQTQFGLNWPNWEFFFNQIRMASPLVPTTSWTMRGCRRSGPLLASLGDVRALATLEPLRRLVRQKLQPFALHRHNGGTPHFELHNNPKSCARQVANLSHPPVVPAVPDPPASVPKRCFEHRSRRTIRTSGSRNTPRTVALARNPANEYRSDRRRCRFPDLAISQHAKI